MAAQGTEVRPPLRWDPGGTSLQWATDNATIISCPAKFLSDTSEEPFYHPELPLPTPTVVIFPSAGSFPP